MSLSPVENDVEVIDPPTDSISSLAFSPKADYLAVGSWDNNVRLYEVGVNGQSRGMAMYSHQGPVLDLCWSKDGNRVLSAGADNSGRIYDVATGQTQQVAQHDAPIKSVKWIDSPHGSVIATGSWDKTLKYWDLRTPSPIATVELPERCFTMDVMYPLLVVGTAGRHIQIFNLTNPTTAFSTISSPLKTQTRVVSCFPTSDGFAVGSVEGRVAVHYVDDKDSSRSYSFRCHRQEKSPAERDNHLIYAINDMTFHPVYGSVTTCGSDGAVNVWDLDGRTRLKAFNKHPGPITASAYNGTGSIMAYAISYDWHRGHAGMIPGHPNRVMLHACKDDEVKKKSVITRKLR